MLAINSGLGAALSGKFPPNHILRVPHVAIQHQDRARKILIEEENDVDELDDAPPAELHLSTGGEGPGTRLVDGGNNHRANASSRH